MDHIVVWTETGVFRDENFEIPCQRLCIENVEPDFSDFWPDSNQKSIYEQKNSENLESIHDNDFFILQNLSEKKDICSELDEIIPKLSRRDIIAFHQYDLEKNYVKQKILSMNCGFCVVLSVNKIIEEILISYSTNKQLELFMSDSTKKNILNQVIIDFPRCDVYLNHRKCENIMDLFSFCGMFRKYIHLPSRNVENLLLMLATQASFYYPFSIVNNIYTNPTSGLHVISSTTNDVPLIDIVNNNGSIDVIFKKNFGYINIKSNKTVKKKFYTFMILTIDLIDRSDGTEINDHNYGHCRSAITYWIKVDSKI
ncbi:MAG: hypothetical protein QXW79_00190 [Thermoplasmata archaeon]